MDFEICFFIFGAAFFIVGIIADNHRDLRFFDALMVITAWCLIIGIVMAAFKAFTFGPGWPSWIEIIRWSATPAIGLFCGLIISQVAKWVKHTYFTTNPQT